MRAGTNDLAECYYQLALLLDARLPLPESLAQLACTFPSGRLADVLARAAEQTASGRALAETLAAEGGRVPAPHLAFLAIGERTGALPDMLFAMARMARFESIVAARFREIMLYPFAVLHLCLWLVLILSVLVVPSASDLLDGLFEGRPLPPLTALVLGFGNAVHHHRVIYTAVCVLLLVASVGMLWLPGRGARALLRLLDCVPGGVRLLRTMDGANLCYVLGMTLRQGAGLPEALRCAAAGVRRSGLEQALHRAADRVEQGLDLPKAMHGEASIDPLVHLMVAHAPETRLADECERLGELLDLRIQAAARSAAVLWGALALAITSGLTAIMVLALFVPFANVLRYLG